MKKILGNLLLCISVMMLNGCASMGVRLDNSSEKPKERVLLATGYSRISTQPQLNQQQNRFATEQAAKINAYRLLAKQVYKEYLMDGLTVADQVIADESYRIYLELFLREAKIIESQKIADLKKITLKLALSSRFYQCISSTVAVVTTCLQRENKVPFTRVGYQNVPMSRVNLVCAASNCGSQFSVSGFSKEKNLLDKSLLSAGLYDAEWTVNMAGKTMLRYLFLTEKIF